MRVIPSWQHWAGPANIEAVYREFPQDLDAPPPPPLGDVGGSLLVIPSWEQWRLARAGRFFYWTTSQDFDAPALAEPETLAQFLVRRPFLRLGPNRYLFHQDYDSAPAAPEPETFAPWMLRRPLQRLGPNLYLFRTTHGEGPVELETFASFLAKPQFRPLGRSPYLWRTAQDLDAPPPPPEPDTYVAFLVRRDLSLRYHVRAAMAGFLSPQDLDAPPPEPPGVGGDYIITLRRRRR